MNDIKKCKCGNTPDIVDDRLAFFVRCENHKPPVPVVYGDNHRHIDNIECDIDAQRAVNSVDWEKAKISAIDNWNCSEYCEV